MRFFAVALLLALSFFSNSEARANEVGRPTFGVGDKFTFTETGYYNRDNVLRTFTWTFKGVVPGTGELIFTEQVGSNSYDLLFTPDMNFVKGAKAVKAMFAPSTLVLSFPMKVGGSWVGKFVLSMPNAAEVTRERQTSVRSYETINLPAGIYEAFKIVSQNRLEGAQRPADEQYHYCPKLGITCAYESKEWDKRRQLVAVERAPVNVADAPGTQ